MFQDLIERYCFIPVTSQVEETIIIPINKMLRKIPNPSSFSRMTKNEGCSNKKIEIPIASGVSNIEEIERVNATAKVFLVCSSCSIKLSIKVMTF